MSQFAPYARIILRYGVGYVLGAGVGEQLALNPDIVNALALGIGAAVEAAYQWAKRKGGAV